MKTTWVMVVFLAARVAQGATPAHKPNKAVRIRELGPNTSSLRVRVYQLSKTIEMARQAIDEKNKELSVSETMLGKAKFQRDVALSESASVKAELAFLKADLESTKADLAKLKIECPPQNALVGVNENNALHGIKAVALIIAIGNEETLSKYSFLRNNIETDVELKLREAGLTINKPDGKPGTFVDGTLLISLDVYKPSDETNGTFAFEVRAEFLRIVRVPFTGMVVLNATTWTSSGVIGTAESFNLPNLRTYVVDEGNKFVNAWLAANPKVAP